MDRPLIKYIGQNISIKSIRDFILYNGLSKNDSIILNQTNYDDLILEYRDTFRESIKIPYFLLDILIKKNKEFNIPINRVGIIKNDPERYLNDSNSSIQNTELPGPEFMYETIYQCGWCGNVVDFDGSKLDSQTRRFKISIHRKFNSTIKEVRVDGYCCPNGDKS